MKYITLLTLLLAMILTSTSAQIPDLLGITNVKALKETPYKTWFKKEFRSYSPNKTIVEQLKHKLDSITITVFMATWCGDSKEQVPRFYKIIKQCNYNTNHVTLICTNRKKTTPEKLEMGKNITKVPTFILYKHGKEIGRIIETPNATLEEDMLRITTR